MIRIKEKIKFNLMEYRTVGGEEKTIPIKAFCSAVIPKHGPDDERLMGLNIGIAIPFEGPEQSEEWFDEFCGEKWDFFDVVLSSDEGFRIPVCVHAGNYYDDAYGSACLFGYFSPGYFEPSPETRTAK